MAVAIKGMSMPKSCHECGIECLLEDGGLGVFFCPYMKSKLQ